MSVDVNKETRGFQAEVRQLLDLTVHSLYSNQEIFLRELVSNASDAAEKLRFEALFEGDTDLPIEVEWSEQTVTVRDNGIGMSREEVVENLGTIAKSARASTTGPGSCSVRPCSPRAASSKTRRASCTG